MREFPINILLIKCNYSIDSQWEVPRLQEIQDSKGTDDVCD